MKLGSISSSKQPTSVLQPNPITKQTLAERTKMPGDVRLLDQDARKKGFKSESIMKIYTEARDNCDLQLTTAMKKRSTAQFVALREDVNTGKMSYSLSLTKLNEGRNHKIFLEITNAKGCIVASVPKKEQTSQPPELKYHRALKGCSNIIQMVDYANGRCYFERAMGDLEQLPKEINNAPQLIKGLLRGGNQMAEGRVMHLDLKFENVFIGMDGEPKFADFEMASFVDNKGIAIGNCASGNLRYYSPERHAYALERLKEKCFPSKHKLGLKDNVWGIMNLISLIERKSTTPWCQLTGQFQDRFDSYVGLFNRSYKKGLEAGETWSAPFLKEIHERVADGLKKCPEGNLFGGLIPQTPLEDLVKRMGELDPEKRISIQEVEKLFDLAQSNPNNYFIEVEKLYSPAELHQENSDSSSSSQQEITSSSDNESLAHSQDSSSQLRT